MATVSLPFTFSPNTPAYSAQVNSNFQAITAQVNGNLNEANLASGGVTPSRLATQPRVKAACTIPFNQSSGSGARVFLGTAEFDTDNLYDDVNDYFTVQTAGMYAVTGSVLQTGVGAGVLLVERGPGGVFAPVGSTHVVAADDQRGGSGQFLTATGIDYFAVGDRIDMAWYNYSGGLLGLASGFLAAQWLSS